MDRCPDQMENCQLLSPEYSFFEQLSKKWNIQSLLVICSNVVLVESIKDLVATFGLAQRQGWRNGCQQIEEKRKVFTSYLKIRGFAGLCRLCFRCAFSRVPVAASVRHDKYPMTLQWVCGLEQSPLRAAYYCSSSSPMLFTTSSPWMTFFSTPPRMHAPGWTTALEWMSWMWQKLLLLIINQSFDGGN